MSRHQPSDLANQFLRASQWQQWRQRGLAGVAAALMLTIVGLAVWFETQSWTVQQGTLWVLVKMGFYSVPAMVEIRPGEFWMGSRDDDPEVDRSEKPRHGSNQGNTSASSLFHNLLKVKD